MAISTIDSNSLNATSDLTINGVTVGKGGGAVSTNTAVGASALASNTTAASSTAIGYQAGNSNSTGDDLNAFGYQSFATSTGGANSGFGSRSGRLTTTGTRNSAFGYYSFYTNTTGSYNTAIGDSALYSNTTASNNTAVGYQSLYSNTASNSTAFGFQSSYNNTSGTWNVVMGIQALYTNTAGTGNTVIGHQAGYTHNPTNAGDGYQTLIGFKAGNKLTTGIGNTFVGASNTNGTGAGFAVTTGSNNTILGGYNGNQGSLDIRTASNYIVLSDGDGNPRAHNNGGSTWSFSGAGNGATTANFYNNGNSTPYGIYVNFSVTAPNNTGQYFFQCVDTGGERMTVRANGGIANYSGNNVNLSDRREKTNFAPSKSYLNTVCAIPVQTFNYIDQNLEEDDGLTLGVVAQDVQAVAPELVGESNWGTEDEPKMRLSIYQTDLQYALMKSIQELKTIVDAQAAEIAELKAKVA